MIQRPHRVPCSQCSRHVRVAEVACPYCHATIDAALQARPVPPRPNMRLGRFAVLASVAGVATVATAATIAAGAGCNGSVHGAAATSAEAGDTSPEDDAGEDASDTMLESDYGLASSASFDEDGGDTGGFDASVEDAGDPEDGGSSGS